MSDAPFCFIIVSSCCTSLTACSRSMFLPVRAASVDGEATRIGRLHACFLDRGHPLLDHFLQALVECLHAFLAASLDRRIHLRNLVLANQRSEEHTSELQSLMR